MEEIERAIDEPIIANTSGATSGSTERTVATTCTSFLNPFGNNGLIGRSINLEVKIAFSEGLPSLLMKPPGILPTEYNLSSKSTLNGKKSIPSRGKAEFVAVTNTTVSPQLTKHAPFANSATFPISTLSCLFPNGISKILLIIALLFKTILLSSLLSK